MNKVNRIIERIVEFAEILVYVGLCGVLRQRQDIKS